jgi:pyruvate kinase
MTTILKRLPRRRTKIVCTLGPRSNSPEVIRQMIDAGMDVARLNFSHGSHEQHTAVMNIVRNEAEKAERCVTIFQDLCGPKVRIGDVDNDDIQLEDGASILLRHYDGSKGNSQVIYVEAFDPSRVLKPGDKVLLSDGKIELVAEKISSDSVSCKIRAGGQLRSRSGIAVPDSKLGLPCLTEKDLKDVTWAVKNDVDYVALSFVASSRDVIALREHIRSLGANIPIIAKVERANALDDIQGIVDSADAVMVARGDLGLELPVELVPGAQRLIIGAANFAGTPVITATQMLVSMVNELRPTRAEVTDVTTAVRDGTDAVMLSEETAVGKHPVEAVKMLDRIICEAERELEYEGFRLQLKGSDQVKVADAVCYAACNAAEKIAAAAIITCSLSGHTARLIAKYRPHHLVFGATPERKTLNRIMLYWGVQPVLITVAEDSTLEDEIVQAMTSVRDNFGLKPGSRVVITAGLRAKKSGSTNVLEIREIPRTL